MVKQRKKHYGKRQIERAGTKMTKSARHSSPGSKLQYVKRQSRNTYIYARR